MIKQPKLTETGLTLIKPLNDIIEKCGLEKSKAERYALGYAPLMKEVLDQSELLKPLDKTKPEDAAKAKRISLDLGKICSRLTAKKKEDKDILLIETRLIDGLFNVAESTARLTQKDADEIVDYLAKIERERLAALADIRRAELESFGADTSYLPLDIMGDEQYERCLESAKLAFEARRVAAEKAERERVEAERLETERIEKERLAEIERLENERKEAERVKAELAEREAELEKERKENAERERLRIEAEEKAKKDREILNRRFEQMILKEISGLGFEQVDNGIENKELGWFIGSRHYDGFDNETEAIEWFKETKERVLIMTQQIEQQRAAETQLAKEREATKAEAEKQAKINEAKLAEQKRLAEIERQKQQKILDDQKAEAEKLAKELQAKKDTEQKELEAKRLAQLAYNNADDKEKIRILFDDIKSIKLPEMKTDAGIELIKNCKISISELKKLIIEKSKDLI